jgi:hypothetical protein
MKNRQSEGLPVGGLLPLVLSVRRQMASHGAVTDCKLDFFLSLSLSYGNQGTDDH